MVAGVYEGLENLCARVWLEDHSFEFQILERTDQYACVARFPFYLKPQETRDFVKFQKALMEWFRGEPFQEDYTSRLLKGETNPTNTWAEIKRDYGLPDTYDFPQE